MPINITDEQISLLAKATLPRNRIILADPENIEHLRERGSSQELFDYMVSNLEACNKAGLNTYTFNLVVCSKDVSLEVVKLVLGNIDKLRESCIESLDNVLEDARNPKVVAEWIKNIEVFAKAKEFLQNPIFIAIRTEEAIQVNTLAEYAKISIAAREAYKKAFDKTCKFPQPTTAEPAQVERAVEAGIQVTQ